MNKLIPPPTELNFSAYEWYCILQAFGWTEAKAKKHVEKEFKELHGVNLPKRWNESKNANSYIIDNNYFDKLDAF